MSFGSSVATAALVAAALAGCASGAIDDNVAAARADVQSRARVDFTWLASDAARARAHADVDAALAGPLGADDAVRIALSYQPALQAALFERASESAAATQSARLPNPVFEFERLAGGGAPDHLEVTRTLTLPLVDLLLLPLRARQADGVQRQLRLRIATDVLRAADTARGAWIVAVAAQQEALYAQQVVDAAEAAGELARRMEAAGNFSALQRAREEAFAADAAAGLAQARRAQRASREALVRALGLDATLADRLRLPDRLPDPPASLPEAAADQAGLQAALDARLDLQLARARLESTARAQGVTRVSGVVDGLTLGPARKAETGQAKEHGLALSVPLPLFDTGDAARAGAQASVEAALQRAAAVAVDAASQLRAADGDRRDAWALAQDYRARLVPLQASITDATLARYNGMLASVFDLLADARAQARTVQRSIAAQRDFWLADAAWQAATVGLPLPATIVATEAP